MQVTIRATNLSPLGLLVVALTSLPGYLLVAVGVLLAPRVFGSLLGALLISHGLDRLITRMVKGRPSDMFEKMKRQAIDLISQALPGFGETIVNPGIRRLTAMLAVLTARWFSQNSAAVATSVFLLGVYVEYVEQRRSFPSIVWGVLTGGLAAAPFVYLLL